MQEPYQEKRTGLENLKGQMHLPNFFEVFFEAQSQYSLNMVECLCNFVNVYVSSQMCYIDISFGNDKY